MSRYIVLIFSLFAILYLGSTNIGPLSIRNICILGLIVFLFVSYKEVSVDICGKLYCLYLAVLLLASIISGNFNNPVFFKSFLSYHISSIALLLALPLLIKSITDINVVTIFVVVVQFVDCVVSFMQFYNIPLGWQIGLAINPGALVRLTDAEYYLSQSDVLLSRSIVFGITSFVVSNGYYLTTFLPIASRHLLYDGAKLNNKMMSLCLLTISVLAIFMVQQRMAFFLMLCYVLFVIYMRIKKSLLSKLILLITAIVFIGLYTFPTDIEMGRLTLDKVGSDSRMNQLTNVINFMNTDSFIWGADLNDSILGDSIGHNTLTDSLRRGGFITFLFYLPLFIAVLYKSIYIGIASQRINAPYTFAFSVSCVIYLAYSFTHSTGLQSGAVQFWFVYALMISSWRYENDDLEEPNQITTK